jgi:hypothetical protein
MSSKEIERDLGVSLMSWRHFFFVKIDLYQPICEFLKAVYVIFLALVAVNAVMRKGHYKWNCVLSVKFGINLGALGYL